MHGRKLSREKNFYKFRGLWLFAKVLSAKFGDLVSFGWPSEQSAKVNILFSTSLWKFSPTKVSYYTVVA